MIERISALPIVIEQTRTFMEHAFRESPHYTFGDPTIMIDHSNLVGDIAGVLANHYPGVDNTVAEITAILHDVGKTVHTDEETLLKKHEELGLQVADTLLDTLALTQTQREQVKTFFTNKENTSLRQLVKDADYIAFYADERLHDAFKAWTDRDKLPHEVLRKLQRFDQMAPIAQDLARPFYEKMKLKWGE